MHKCLHSCTKFCNATCNANVRRRDRCPYKLCRNVVMLLNKHNMFYYKAAVFCTATRLNILVITQKDDERYRVAPIIRLYSLRLECQFRL